MAFEVFGTWGEGAQAGLQILCQAAKEYMSEQRALQFQLHTRAALCIELQRGNARILRTGLRKARSARHMTYWLPELPD